jgi:hypothetical protein
MFAIPGVSGKRTAPLKPPAPAILPDCEVSGFSVESPFAGTRKQEEHQND